MRVLCSWHGWTMPTAVWSKLAPRQHLMVSSMQHVLQALPHVVLTCVPCDLGDEHQDAALAVSTTALAAATALADVVRASRDEPSAAVLEQLRGAVNMVRCSGHAAIREHGRES